MTYFFSQSYHNIRAKLKKLDRGPLTPQTEVLVTAVKVFHSQDEKAKCQKYQMLAQAMRGPNPQTKRGESTPTKQELIRPLFQMWTRGTLGQCLP
jgi:hypothetical protein